MLVGAYSNIEIDDVPGRVVSDINRLHPHVSHVDGAWEEKKHCQAWQQQANDDRGGYV